MNQVRKHFKCFRCDYHNNVIVPQHFKGKKCKRCHTFNYFNYIPNYRRRTNDHNNINNSRRINIISNNENNFRDEFFGFNNNVTIRNPIINRNNNINASNNTRNNINTDLNSLRKNILINRLNALNNSRTNAINNNQNQHLNNNSSSRNNQINLNNNILPTFNNIKQEESIIIPWLNKERATEEIRRKYKDENCPICLEEINGDITITKCKHIFHYKCLAQNIKNYEKTECPICRSDVKTGRKKEVVNRVNPIRRNDDHDFLEQVYLLNMFSNNGGNQRNNSFENNNIRLNQQRVNSNNNNNNNGNNNNRSCFLNFISNIFSVFRSFF